VIRSILVFVMQITRKKKIKIDDEEKYHER